MKTKLAIIGTFMGIWIVLFLAFSNAPQAPQKVKTIDTIQIVSNYLITIQDSIEISLGASWETFGTPFYRVNQEILERQEKEMERLLILASGKMTTMDFEIVLNNVICHE